MKFDFFKKRHIILKHDEIIQAIQQLANQLNHDYKDKELTIMALMNSCLVFLVELLMRLNINVEVFPVKVSTYTETGIAEKTGDHYLSTDFKLEKMKDRNVLILDDLIDTGDTLNFMVETTKSVHPKSLKTIVLFSKNGVKRKFNIKPDYVGTTVPNV
jgi:hypoxanthine phosphoribosyltransferase